ncbi:hypothetical protein C2845_PM09G10160 [Panicum miliaceum]|uniref:Uncharacterized protein n=1 Tax=Panicum miliaceum TaxID=4540 RepID=A0A3L6S0N2_PANMI|nr:hypothetical protein C2845_PM09G10160 [Panicum miliaceum]
MASGPLLRYFWRRERRHAMRHVGLLPPRARNCPAHGRAREVRCSPQPRPRGPPRGPPQPCPRGPPQPPGAPAPAPPPPRRLRDPLPPAASWPPLLASRWPRGAPLAPVGGAHGLHDDVGEGPGAESLRRAGTPGRSIRRPAGALQARRRGRGPCLAALRSPLRGAGPLLHRRHEARARARPCSTAAVGGGIRSAPPARGEGAGERAAQEKGEAGAGVKAELSGARATMDVLDGLSTTPQPPPAKFAV